jgi:hypothetical protein
MDVLAKEDDRAHNITIGNPPAGRNLNPGQQLLSYGTAYNALDNQILVSVSLDNGRLLTEQLTTVDYFGYWELDLYIPANASGPAFIEASYGDRSSDEFVRSQIAVTIGQLE